MTPRPPFLVAAALLLALVPAVRARADGDDARAAAIENRVYDVGALVELRGMYGPEPGPFGMGEDAAPKCIAEAPPPGQETEEFERPSGGAPDLLDALKRALGASVWEREGNAASTLGSTRLLVKAPADVQKQVGEFLLRSEREAFTVVTVDVVALAGEAPEAATPDALQQAIGRGALKPLALVRASGLVNQAVTAFHGGQQAFVVDQKVVVAKDAKTTDPVVSVPRDGISLLFRASRAAEDVDVAIDAWLARVTPTPPRESGGERVEVPEVDGRRARGAFHLKPGAWTLLSAGGGVAFAARATVRAFEDPLAWGASLGIESPPGRKTDVPVGSERFPIGDLASRTPNWRGTTIRIAPSNFTPPEPPEMPEPMQPFPVDQLIDLVKTSIDPPSWEMEGGGLAVRSDTLLAQNDAPRLAAIRRLLDGLRERCLKTVRVRARVVTVPAASLENGWAGGAPDDAAAILALTGARPVDRGSFQVVPGTRRAYVGGVSRRYVSDYDPEIAEKATIGNPVVRDVFEGLSLDVRPTRVTGGGAYLCEVRLDRSTWRGSRQVPTRYGDLECPSIGLLRFRGSLVVKSGETRIVSAGVGGDEATFVFLTLTED